MEKILSGGEKSEEAQRREYTAGPVLMEFGFNNSLRWVLQ